MSSVLKAVESGDRRAALEAMQERIAIAIDDLDTPARDLAALTRRGMDIAKELEAMDIAEAEDAEDEPTPDEPFDPSAI